MPGSYIGRDRCADNAAADEHSGFGIAIEHDATYGVGRVAIVLPLAGGMRGAIHALVAKQLELGDHGFLQWNAGVVRTNGYPHGNTMPTALRFDSLHDLTRLGHYVVHGEAKVLQ